MTVDLYPWSFESLCNISLSSPVKMSLQISVMLILLAPCFWPEVEYIALLEQMESEFRWAAEIGWLPAKNSGLVVSETQAQRSRLESILCSWREKTKVSPKFVWNQNAFVKIVHLQMFTQCSKRNGVFWCEMETSLFSFAKRHETKARAKNKKRNYLNSI